MHKNFRYHAGEEEPVEAEGESEAGPIMPILHHLKRIAVEVNIPVKVLLVEGLHRDSRFSAILLLVLRFAKGEVVFNGESRKFRLFILAWGEAGGRHPEDRKDRDCEEDDEEDPCLQATT